MFKTSLAMCYDPPLVHNKLLGAPTINNSHVKWLTDTQNQVYHQEYSRSSPIHSIARVGYCSSNICKQWYLQHSTCNSLRINSLRPEQNGRCFPDDIFKWVRSRNYGCLVTWFCYQLIAKPGNKTAAVSWPEPNAFTWIKIYKFWLKFHWSLFPRVQLTMFQHWFR